jgi:ornithine carbamoyltransferase
MFTIREQKGSLEGLKIVYIGDGNNMANSWIEAALLIGFPLTVAAPKAYEPYRELADRVRAKGLLTITDSPVEAARDADVINTDVWVSMGMEKEKEERKKAFSGFCVDDKLLDVAKPGAIVMHCLPAYRNQEISEAVFERFQDVIFSQAENRLYAQQALLEWLIKDG